MTPKILSLVLFAATLASPLHAQVSDRRPPVIDVHMHAPMSPGQVEEFAPRLQSQLESMDSLNVRYVMLTGVPDVLFAWRPEVEKHVGVLPGLLFPCVNGAAVMWGRPCFESGEDWPDLDRLRDHVEAGRIGALGEITTQFLGLGPSDPAFDPYFALAEEYDLPVFIHMLPGKPEWRYDGKIIGNFPVPDMRASAGDPLLLDEALRKYPGVRVAVVHSGWPLAEEMADVLKRHPQVYAEIGLSKALICFRGRNIIRSCGTWLMQASAIAFSSDRMRTWRKASLRLWKRISCLKSRRRPFSARTRRGFCGSAMRYAETRGGSKPHFIARTHQLKDPGGKGCSAIAA